MPDPWKAAIRRARLRIGRSLIGGYAQLSYSQEGEDRILERLVGHFPSGFYVDIGCHDPRRFSNTYLLYLRGWRGIVVDPADGLATKFARLRPRDVYLSMAVGLTEGDANYFEFDEPAMNTMSDERAKVVSADTDYKVLRTREVRTARLESILSEHMPHGTAIDVLSVDVEGHDADVLASNDWQRFRPRVVIAEVLSMESLDSVRGSDVGTFLTSNDYRPYSKAMNSVLFVDGSRDWRRYSPK